MSKWQFYTTDEIKPEGWIKRQLQLQADGLNGNLDKIWPDVRDSGWVGGKRESWERAPYWLDGFIPLAYLLDNEDMKLRAKKYIDAIIDNQQPDGWICPCKRENIPGYDTWALLLILKVLKVYYDCSKDERVPPVIYKALKNFYELLTSKVIRLKAWGKFRWYEGIIAIKFTYDRCREDWLVKLAKLLKRQGVDFNTLTPLWQKPKNIWRLKTHIVNIAMMLKYEALYCEMTGEEYTDRAEALRTILDQYNGTATELFTGDECLSGLSPIQGTELCAVVEQMFSYELLFAFTGDSKWAQRLETIAFNALPATISEDMWTHQYVQMSNQIACQRFKLKPIFRTNGWEAHLFGLEPNYGCCTANFGQGWPKLMLSAFMHSDNEIISAVALPSTLNADGVSIKLETDYPFKNEFKYTVRADKDFTFTVRIPSFAKKLTVNSQPAKTADLHFEIKADTESVYNISFETEPYFASRPNNLVTVRCGSLIFSVPIEYDKKMHEYTKNKVVRKFPYCDYELIPKSKWNYAYSSDELEVQIKDVADIPFSGSMPPVVIKAKVKEIDWGLEKGYSTVCRKTPKSTVPISDEQEIELHPYGCSRLRMTELAKADA